jgi:hypothetical protein
MLSEEGRSYSPELYAQKCRSINLLPLSNKFDLNDLLFFYKLIKNLVPSTLSNCLTFYEGGSRLRRCHLDRLSIVYSLNLLSQGLAKLPIAPRAHYLNPSFTAPICSGISYLLILEKFVAHHFSNQKLINISGPLLFSFGYYIWP